MFGKRSKFFLYKLHACYNRSDVIQSTSITRSAKRALGLAQRKNNGIQFGKRSIQSVIMVTYSRVLLKFHRGHSVCITNQFYYTQTEV